MAIEWVLWDRIREVLASHSGTGTFQLEGSADTGYDTFGARLSDGDTFVYVAENASGQWEVGKGTYVSATDDVQRTTVYYSSSGDTAVSFNAEELFVYLDVNATMLRNPDFQSVNIYKDDAATTAMLELEQDGSGDCAVHFLLTGGQQLMVGIDNSTTNDDFVISDSTALGTSDRLVINGSTGHVWADALNLGTAPSTTNSNAVIFCALDDAGTTTPIADFMNDGAGDAFLKVRLTLGQTFCFGIDNSDADSFILADATNISSGQRLRIDGSTGEVQVYETLGTDGELDNGNSGAADTIDWGNGNHQKSTLTAACTYTFTAPTVGAASLTFKTIQNGTGGFAITWPSSINWPGNVAPTPVTTANTVCIWCFYYDGSEYHGSLAIDDSRNA